MKTQPHPVPVVSLIVLFLSMALAPLSLAQKVKTVAGGFVGDGRAATAAAFQVPTGLVQDSHGNKYVSDQGGQRIRKITKAGIISTYAGTGIAGFGGDGGQAHLAMVNVPLGMTLDAAGDLVFADGLNNRVRKITTAGIISTIAGNGTAGYSGDGGPATSASMNLPWGLTYDAAGNLYISDLGNNVIRRVDTGGIITTYAGNGTAAYCGDNGQATLACLHGPKGVVTDPGGNLYISDSANHRVRQVSSSGIITTFAGSGNPGFSGDGGSATAARIGNPKGLAFQAGTLYISNAGEAHVRYVAGGIINTLIGNIVGYDGDNNPPLSTDLNSPTGIVPIGSSMLVADQFNSRVRELASGLVTTVGGGYIGANGTTATAAAMAFPQSVAFDKSGNMYIVEFSGNRVRKIDTTGKISVVAGTGVSGYTGDNGPATSATLYFPQSAVVDAAGNLFIADQGNNVIRKVDTSGTITTFSSNVNYGGLGFMAFNSAGTLYVADAGACVVWSVDSTGNPTAVAGQLFNCGYNGDLIKATTALLNTPYGVAFDARGNLYIADSSNYRVRKVNSAGIISTIAGNGTACASSTSACGDGGAATVAQLNIPIALAVSGGPTVYIADEYDMKIRKVSGGIISTYAGTGLSGYNGNNLAALSTNFDDPVDLAINPVNKALYVVDDIQARAREIH